jgi:hypothetical protein
MLLQRHFTSFGTINNYFRWNAQKCKGAKIIIRKTQKLEEKSLLFLTYYFQVGIINDYTELNFF